MPALMIREELPPGELHRLAKAPRDLRVARRLLAVAAVLDGLSREAAARGWDGPAHPAGLGHSV